MFVFVMPKNLYASYGNKDCAYILAIVQWFQLLASVSLSGQKSMDRKSLNTILGIYFLLSDIVQVFTRDRRL